MAVVILDKDMPSEVRFPADNIYERILYKTFNAVKSYNINSEERIPPIPSFRSIHVATVNVYTDEGVEMPLTSDYNTVLAVSSHIDDIAGVVTYSMDLGNQF